MATLNHKIIFFRARKLSALVLTGFICATVSSASAQELTRPQMNAVRSAENYLMIGGFSKEGLIRQLSHEHGDRYKERDARVAVESLNVDWGEQAKLAADRYLDIMGFSCDGLIQQLSHENGDMFTPSQASYGAHSAGAC